MENLDFFLIKSCLKSKKEVFRRECIFSIIGSIFISEFLVFLKGNLKERGIFESGVEILNSGFRVSTASQRSEKLPRESESVLEVPRKVFTWPNLL